MLVAAIVPPMTRARLRSDLEVRARIHMASSPLELERLIRTEPLDALLIEPPLPPAIASAVLGLIATYRSLPLVCAASTAARTGPELRPFWRVRPSFVLLESHEDAGVVLGRIVARAPSRRLATRVLGILRARLSLLPPAICMAVEQLAECADPPSTVATLSACASCSRRSLERSLRITGVRSARMLALLPRVVRACCYLRDPAFTIGDVTRKVRVSSQQVLLAQLRELTGIHCWTQLRALPEPQLAGQMAARLLCGTGSLNEGVHLHVSAAEATSEGAMSFAQPQGGLGA